MIVEGVTLAVVEDRQPSSKTREGGYRQPATWHSRVGKLLRCSRSVLVTSEYSFGSNAYGVGSTLPGEVISGLMCCRLAVLTMARRLIESWWRL
jgi:hypothetical protein